MKKLIFLTVMVWSALILNAQNFVSTNGPDTIYASDNVFVIGDTTVFVNVFGADNFNPGDTGQAVIWDFSNKIPIPDSLEHYSYVDTDNIPDDFHIPQTTNIAELLAEQDSNVFYYRNNDGSSPAWYRTGFFSAVNGLQIWADYDQDILLYQYPLIYGNEFSTSYSADNPRCGWAMPAYGIDDDMNIQDGNISYTIDGWGILITPYKTYKNVLRMHLTESFTMNLMLYGNQFVSSQFDDDGYYWFSPQYKGYVMKYINSHYEDSQGSDETTYYLAWLNQEPTSLDVDFVASDTNAVSYIDTITLYNISTPIAGTEFTFSINPSTYEFVDTINGVHPRVVFTAPGDYTVTLEAENSNWGTDQITKTDYIHVTEAPKLIAGFYADPTVIDVNGIVTMHNTTNHTDGTSWLWQVSPGSEGNQWGFVDFTTNTDFEPHIQFYQAGCYSIRLIATNDQYYNSPDDTIRLNYINVGGGCGDAYTITFNVKNTDNQPIANASVNITGIGTHTTDDNGQTTFSLYNGVYNYSVSANGYNDTTGSFTVSDADADVNVVLRAISTYIAANENIKIYPNPADDILFINVPSEATFKLYDLNGKQILNSINFKDVAAIDVSFLPSGIYTVEIITGQSVKRSKLVIE